MGSWHLNAPTAPQKETWLRSDLKTWNVRHCLVIGQPKFGKRKKKAPKWRGDSGERLDLQIWAWSHFGSCNLASVAGKIRALHVVWPSILCGCIHLNHSSRGKLIKAVTVVTKEEEFKSVWLWSWWKLHLKTVISVKQEVSIGANGMFPPGSLRAWFSLGLWHDRDELQTTLPLTTVLNFITPPTHGHCLMESSKHAGSKQLNGLVFCLLWKFFSASYILGLVVCGAVVDTLKLI